MQNNIIIGKLHTYVNTTNKKKKTHKIEQKR